MRSMRYIATMYIVPDPRTLANDVELMSSANLAPAQVLVSRRLSLPRVLAGYYVRLASRNPCAREFRVCGGDMELYTFQSSLSTSTCIRRRCLWFRPNFKTARGTVAISVCVASSGCRYSAQWKLANVLGWNSTPRMTFMELSTDYPLDRWMGRIYSC